MFACDVHFGMLCLSAWCIMFVNIVLVACMLVGDDVSEKPVYMSLVKLGPICFLAIG